MLRNIPIAAVVISLLICARAYALEPAIRSSLNKKEIGVGEEIRFTVEMAWEQEDDSSLIITLVTPPSSALLEPAGSSQRSFSRLTRKGLFAGTVLEYVYRAREEGSGDIAPALIEYSFSDKPGDKRIIRTRPVPVKVISQTARFGKSALRGILGTLSAALLFGVFAFFTV